MGHAQDHPEAGARPGMLPLTMTFTASALAVRGALQAVKGVLREQALAEEIAGLVEIVLAEVLNNIVEHAYGDEGHGEIDLEMENRGNALAFVIRDAGRPMPGGAPPAGRPQDLDVEPHRLPEGGFGWHLIRELTSGLEYRRLGERNELRFLVPVDGPVTRH